MPTKDHSYKSKLQLPLTYWLISIGIAFIVIITIANLSIPQNNPFKDEGEIYTANFKIKLHNLKKELRNKKSDYKVLIFGSSLTDAGVDNSPILTKNIRAQGKDIEIIKFHRAGANYTTLETDYFIEFVESIQPDVFCIEDQTFLLQLMMGLKETKAFGYDTHFNFIYNINLIKHKLFPERVPEPGFMGAQDSTVTFNGNDMLSDKVMSHIDSTQYEVKYRFARKKRKTKRFNKLMGRLHEKGTRFIIHNVPRPHKIEEVFLSIEEKQKIAKLIEQYKTDYNLDYWIFEDKLPFQYYQDKSHLNIAGREVYSKWIFNKINQLEFPAKTL